MNLEELQAAAGKRYEIEGFLTKGGMGSIYTARHRSLGSRVAIKVLPAEIASSTVRLARFKREAALAANLSHPNIVPVFEFDATPGLAYLVMPFVEGETLSDQLTRQGKLDYATVRRMLGQIASALGFAHQRDVVHRDVKPANIIREEATGRWLITDFGIAHVTDPADTEITQTGTVIGTPAYMAPEQRWGGQVDGRADLYSLAAMAFQSVCGIPTEQLPDELAKGRSEIERTIRSAQPTLKPEVARALSWPLVIKKEDRPEAAEEWLDALEKAEGTKARLWWAWAAGAAAVLIAGSLFLRSTPSTHDASATRTIAVLPFQSTVQDDSSNRGWDLARALDFQLQWLPGYQKLGPIQVQQEITIRHGTDTPDVPAMVEVARSLGATIALAGMYEERGDDIRIDIQIHDLVQGGATHLPTSEGPADSLTSLVLDLVEQLASHLAIEASGWQGALPQGGRDAIQPYLQADRDFREGRYQVAVNRFDEVLRLDSTFAPAHFKRMLARIFAARPSQYSTWLKAALAATSAHQDRLDPWSQQLLNGYQALLRDGNVRRADSLAQDLVDRNPQAESLFLLGYVRFYFRAVLPNTSRREAAHWFREAVARDSRFAMSLWHLAIIGMAEEDGTAEGWLDRLLAVDSTSFWAEMAMLADSALYRAGLPNIPESVNSLSLGALELFSITLGELDSPATTRPVGQEALLTLWNRAESPSDKRLAFRMSMADRLAHGRFAGADSLVQEGRRNRVPEDEIARWIVLSAVTRLPDLATEEERLTAVAELASGAATDTEAAWLLARWYLDEDPSEASTWITRLRTIARDPATTSPFARSLDKDIQAMQVMSTGDTTAALSLWDDATQYYSLADDYIFGLTASLWPLRVQRAEILHARGLNETALDVTRTFEQMFGFVDQVAWPTILNLKAEAAIATGDPARVPGALAAYRRLERLLQDANGARGRALLQEAISKKLEQPGN